MRALWLALPLAVFVACGGQSESHDGESGGSAGTKGGDSGSSGDAGTGAKGGSSGTSGTSGTGPDTGGSSGTSGVGGADGGAFPRGGTPGVGGSGATSGVAGTSGGSGGGAGFGGCCGAIPTCQHDDVQLTPGAPCLPGYTCEQITLCCSTIQCATPAGQCEGYPTCDPGDTELDEDSELDVPDCPRGAICYTRTLCGYAILCRDDACDPEAEYNRKYIAMGPECGLIDYTCTANTEPFGNACGCGCEQSPDCPPSVDCSPGTEPRPECTDEFFAKCPYTLRAL